MQELEQLLTYPPATARSIAQMGDGLAKTAGYAQHEDPKAGDRNPNAWHALLKCHKCSVPRGNTDESTKAQKHSNVT